MEADYPDLFAMTLSVGHWLNGGLLEHIYMAKSFSGTMMQHVL